MTLYKFSLYNSHVPSPTESVAANVRAEAARAQYTQVKIAELLGVSQQAISDRMKGRTPFSVEELVRLAAAFGVPLTHLFPEPTLHVVDAAS